MKIADQGTLLYQAQGSQAVVSIIQTNFPKFKFGTILTSPAITSS